MNSKMKCVECEKQNVRESVATHYAYVNGKQVGVCDYHVTYGNFSKVEKIESNIGGNYNEEIRN